MKLFFSTFLFFAIHLAGSCYAQDHSALNRSWIFLEYDSAGLKKKPLKSKECYTRLRIYDTLYTCYTGSRFSGTLAFYKDTLEWKGSTPQTPAFTGLLGYWEKTFRDSIWQMNQLHKTTFRISGDTLFLLVKGNRKWTFIDSAKFRFEQFLLPDAKDEVLYIDSSLKIRFPLPKEGSFSVFKPKKGKIMDTIWVSSKKTYFDLNELFLPPVDSKPPFRQVIPERIVYVETIEYTYRFSDDAKLKVRMSTNRIDHVSHIKYSYDFMKMLNGRPLIRIPNGDCGLKFISAGNEIKGARSREDSTYSPKLKSWVLNYPADHSDTLASIIYNKKQTVRGANYQNTITLKSGSIRASASGDPSVNENPITYLHLSPEMGIIKIEYKNGEILELVNQ